MNDKLHGKKPSQAKSNPDSGAGIRGVTKLSDDELDRLLYEVKFGKISRLDLDGVASDLSDPRQLFVRISILARSLDTKYIPVLERCAIDVSDTGVALLALRYLITEHKRREFVPILKQYAKGTEWALLSSAQLSAIQIAEFYLRDTKDVEMAAILLDIFGHPATNIIKDAAHDALLSYADDPVKRDWSTINRDYEESDYRYDVIAKIKQQLEARKMNL